MESYDCLVPRFRLLLLLLLAVCFVIIPAASMKDPTYVYCTALGYEYSIVMTDAGEQGFCILPDGREVDAWQFLQGKTGNEYSYCALQGYEIKTVSDPEKCLKFLTDECAVCVLADGSEVEVTDLMGLDFRETFCGDGVCGFPETYLDCPADCPPDGPDGYCNTDYRDSDEDCIPDDSEEEETVLVPTKTPSSSVIVLLSLGCAACMAAILKK